MKVAYQFNSTCGLRLRKIFLKIKAFPKAPVARDQHEAKSVSITANPQSVDSFERPILPDEAQKKKSGWLHDSIWGHIKCGGEHDYGGR